MTAPRPTALIADDEPLLRQELARLLAVAWPELNVVASVRSGREAIDQFEALRPEVCFLDVKMPGLSGVEVADRIGARAHIVFVTAYEEYAVRAFAQGAIDYLLKPVEPARLAETAARIKGRLHVSPPAPISREVLRELAAQLGRSGPPQYLRWVRAQVGSAVHLVAVEDIEYLRSDTKYTRITWRQAKGQRGESLVRVSLKELLVQLDPAQFAQIHRSVVVNLGAVSHVVHGENETAHLHLKDRPEVLPVSRHYVRRFRQM